MRAIILTSTITSPKWHTDVQWPLFEELQICEASRPGIAEIMDAGVEVDDGAGAYGPMKRRQLTRG